MNGATTIEREGVVRGEAINQFRFLFGVTLFPLLLLGCSQQARTHAPDTPAPTAIPPATTPVPPSTTTTIPPPTTTIPPTTTTIPPTTTLPLRPFAAVEDLAGFWNRAGYAVEFKDDGGITESNGQGTLMVAGEYWFEDAQFHIVDTDGPWACFPRGVVGVYEAQGDADRVRFTKVEDQCSARARAMTASWWQRTAP